MTAHPNPTPNGAAHPSPQHDARQDHEEAVLVAGDIPIAVWRLDDGKEATSKGNSLASRLAQRLIQVYTDRGNAVIDFDSDPQLEHASANTYRTYLSLNDPSAVADLDALTEPVNLLVLRWPPRCTTRTLARIAALFTACLPVMTADACTIATVNSTAPNEVGMTYAEHLDELLPAAHAAGLTPVLYIVAVTGARRGDQFLYHATQAEADAARQDRNNRAYGPGNHVDLVVFTNNGQRDASSRLARR